MAIDIVVCYTLTSCKADKDNQQNSKRKLLLITSVPSNIIYFFIFGTKQHSASIFAAGTGFLKLNDNFTTYATEM